MPQSVKRFSALFLFIFIFTAAFSLKAQTIAQTDTAQPKPRTTADVMRERIMKAKTYLAVKNYNGAIYELENIRRETVDPTVHGVLNVLLMNSYLELGDYDRAQKFLTEYSKLQEKNTLNAAANYFAIAGQVIKGARTQAERYRALGLSLSDRNLALEAQVDLEGMRQTLEMVVEQSKLLSKNKTEVANAMALVEEASGARSNLAKDEYDANRWKSEISNAREQLTNARSNVINVVNEPNGNAVAVNEKEVQKVDESAPIMMPVGKEDPVLEVPQTKPEAKKTTEKTKPLENPKEEIKEETAAENTTANTTGEAESSKRKRRIIGSAPKTEPKADETETKPVAEEKNAAEKTPAAADDDSPIEVGSLIGYATSKANPIYPPTARNMRMTGVVKLDIIVDEDGRVAEVQNVDGPALLQDAAATAVRKWRFKPFKRDGQPAKASGYVSFNFRL